MLARLSQVNGVQSSSINESGTLIRLTLHPGADPERVAAEASRVVREQVQDRIADRVGGGDAATAVQQEEWLDERRVAARNAAGIAAPQVRQSRGVWWGVLLVFMVISLWLLWRRYRGAAVGLVPLSGDVGPAAAR